MTTSALIALVTIGCRTGFAFAADGLVAEVFGVLVPADDSSDAPLRLRPGSVTRSSALHKERLRIVFIRWRA